MSAFAEEAVEQEAISVLGYPVSASGLSGDVDHAWNLFASGAKQRFAILFC